MVTLSDGKPVPQVIDFGVAKATGSKLTEHTMFTEFGSIVGTLEYMSPEQADRNQIDIDTRSDIYSLGVLLYELLTGSTPLDKQHLRGAAILELLRIIKEDEPQKPSTRLSTTDELPSIAANRNLEPKKLSGLVRGELDWIVMKALDKDRERRYETANGFAMDVQRYLADEPVQACPPSAGYRLRKFASRNKAALAMAAVISTALILAASISTWQAIRATRAERLADERLKKETAAHQAEQVQREAAERARQRALDNLQLAREAVDQMLTEVGHKDLVNVPQMEPLRRALLEKALEFYQRFLQDNPDDAAIRMETGLAYHRIGKFYDRLGQYSNAERTHQDAIRILEELTAEFPDDPQYASTLAETYRTLANTIIHLRRWPDAEQVTRQALAPARQLVARFPQEATHPPLLANSLNTLAVVLQQRHKLEEAETTIREALTMMEKFRAADPEDARLLRGLSLTCNSLSGVLTTMGQLDKAEEMRRRAVDAAQILVSKFPESSEYVHGLGHERLSLGVLLQKKVQFPDAQEQYQAALDLFAKVSADYPKTTQFRASLAEAQTNLAGLLRDTGKPEEAEPLYRQAYQNWTTLVAEAPSQPRYPSVLDWTLHMLVELLRKQGKPEEAESVYSHYVQFYKKLVVDLSKDPQHQGPQAAAHLTLSRLLRKSGRIAEAEQHERQALELSAALSEETTPANLRLMAWLLVTDRDEQRRDPRRAVGLARRAVELQPQNAQFWNTLGAAHYRAGNSADAIAALKRSMDLRQSGNAFDRFFLAMAHRQLGDKREAGKWYQLAIERSEQNPQDQDLRRLRAEAEKLFGPIDRTGWDEGLTHFRQGVAQSDAGRMEKAAEAFRMAIAKMEPFDEQFPFINEHQQPLGQCYLRLCRATKDANERTVMQSKALAHWQRLNEDFPNSAGIWSSLGEAYALTQQWQNAADAQTKSIELRADFGQAWQRRGWAHTNLQQWKAALADFEQTIELGTPFPRIWVGKAAALAQLNRPDEAVSALEDAIAKGYRNSKELQEREDLAPLRQRDDFKQLLEELKANKK
jgi:tetratricopeptide (TPR) repeat protein